MQISLVEDVENLFLKKIDPNWFVPPRSELSIRKGLELALSRIKFTEKYGNDIEVWLDKQNSL